MTHAPETGAMGSISFQRQFPVRVSCKSGTEIVWYQFPAPIRRTLFYSIPSQKVACTLLI